MRDLLDYWNWWKTRRSQIVTLVMLAGLLIWMNMALWQSERNYRGLVFELRQNYRQQEATRERQFSRVLTALDAHLSRLDKETARELKQQDMIRQMLEPIVKNAMKSADQKTTKPAQR